MASRSPERRTERRARIGAGDDPDEGDADLHGREELARVAASASATRAPPLPRSAASRSRAGRAETIASSDIEKTPLSRISATRIASSVQGNGDIGTARLADQVRARYPASAGAWNGDRGGTFLVHHTARARRPRWGAGCRTTIARETRMKTSRTSFRAWPRSRCSACPPASPIPTPASRRSSRTAIGAAGGAGLGYLLGDLIGGKSRAHRRRGHRRRRRRRDRQPMDQQIRELDEATEGTGST
jgi:hypothetical protein